MKPTYYTRLDLDLEEPPGACDACGALVNVENQSHHDDYHAALDRVAAVADASHDFTGYLVRKHSDPETFKARMLAEHPTPKEPRP